MMTPRDAAVAPQRAANDDTGETARMTRATIQRWFVMVSTQFVRTYVGSFVRWSFASTSKTVG